MIAANVTGRHQWDVPILPNVPAFLRVSLLERILFRTRI